MSEELFIRHCAPTLASIKTGSLFNFRCPSPTELHESIRSLNRRLGGKGMRVLPLKYENGTALIYAYRPRKLQQDLKHETAHRLLGDCGYCSRNPNHCLMHLKARLAQQTDFPHEIGLFLGYPPEDVEGFIHRKQEAKFSGYWKVYGDVAAARKIFAQYKKCTDIYMQQWANGRALERLTVAQQ